MRLFGVVAQAELAARLACPAIRADAMKGPLQQLVRFSGINPEEYSRLQEAEGQKQQLELQVELRERHM